MNGVAPYPLDGDEPDTPLEAIWERIENWLMENAPMTLLTLNAGATDKDFWAAEAAIGFPLPVEIRESYRIHNGQSEGVLMNETRFLSLADMAAAWQRIQAAPTSQTVTSRWLPLTENEAGESIFLDTTPTGVPGPLCIIRRDEDSPEVVGDTFTDWMARFADLLEAGRYVWSNDYDGLVVRRRDEMR